jgi:excisionase family DNA binding protein
MTAAIDTLSRDELRNLAPVIDLTTAARVLGISRHKAYELVRTGDWPTRVLRLGRSVRVPTSELLELIGMSGMPSGRRTRAGNWRRP